MVGTGKPEYLEWLETDPAKDAPLLMGATTYRVMSELTAGGEPGTDVLNAVPKYVFSSSLSEPLSWENSTLVRTDAVEYVRRLKEESELPLRTIGSIALCRSLLVGGVVDRFRVVVFPVITGATGQDRIYDGYPDVLLELVETRTFDHRTQLLEYIPTVLDGPPGR